MDTVCRTDAHRRAGPTLPLLAAATLLLAATAAHSQSSITVTPLSEQECTALAKKVSDKSGISVDSLIGDADAYMYSNVGGSACLLSGTATGLSKSLKDLATVAGDIEGWTRDSSYDADAPGATSVTYRRGTDWFGLSIGAEPPAGSCDAVMISECRAPMQEWTWTLSGMAFSTRSSSDKPTL